MNVSTIERLTVLLDPAGNWFFNATAEEAEAAVASGDLDRVRSLQGQFAIVAKTGRTVRMARSIGRPLRFFLAKHHEGPWLVASDRIDKIADYLVAQKLAGQFHPSYTRMVPAHYILSLELVGCPDPNPKLERFFTPQRNSLPPDLDIIGQHYIGAVATAIDRWLDHVPKSEPLGVMFSGGIDSGAVFLLLLKALLRRGESPARLKAFTLSLDGAGRDALQAHAFLKQLGLEMFLEVLDVPVDQVSYHDAVRVIEDYKPLDVQSATMATALCKAIRARYPQWRYLVDGDGGDENLKDYPIHENPELTIRSVLNNPLLYHEGWGVGAVKHSLTYSGGQSRGHVRTYAPAQAFGFSGFSPYATVDVIASSEAIPFIELTDWREERLYELKGEIVRRGIKVITGDDLPVFPKQRFQHGALAESAFAQIFPSDESAYRRAYEQSFDNRFQRV